ncbi:AraC family transcriptional regulator [Clostridium estertheticum]|uniref:AraC family transcriptional regulator n=1 Tax=Clostridium estertheticum TaxID=238834 RepID=UPI001C0E7979|nr:AraC family transcriptional regulator [Clostridium estertheticum]MBU3072631.1 AraC family transcriptional regulator [Clostridium estertheticum]MBU3162724.1 AraC family transcriptional regulator [Clostridium estertheticum]MCB2340177.1 AraC family transcriptional regulator [Clostridium estertheticum]
MAYKLNKITIRTDNSKEGINNIGDIWNDITSGKLPIIFDSEHVFQQGISPISKYSNYSSDENGDYDLTIMAVTADFFQKMDDKVSKGSYKKYDEKDENGEIGVCTRKAWEKVWSEQKSGDIHRTFTADFESTVPGEYTKDGKVHCYLYVAIQ